MNVRCIDWVSIPKETHLSILSDVPIHGYIDSLPYDTRGYPSWKIPVLNPVEVAEADPSIMIDIEYKEFRKCRTSKKTYVWQRTR